MPQHPQHEDALTRTVGARAVGTVPLVLVLSDAELADLATLEAVGLDFAELYRRHLAPQVAVAAEMLRELDASGMSLDRAGLVEVWDTTMTPAALDALYAADSELGSGLTLSE